jgi:hypothetical protein
VLCVTTKVLDASPVRSTTARSVSSFNEWVSHRKKKSGCVNQLQTGVYS